MKIFNLHLSEYLYFSLILRKPDCRYIDLNPMKVTTGENTQNK